MSSFTKTKIVTNNVKDPSFKKSPDFLDWTKSIYWTITSGHATCTNPIIPGITSVISQAINSLENGTLYKIRYQVLNYTGPSGPPSKFKLSGSFNNIELVTSFSSPNQTHEITASAVNTSNTLSFILESDGTSQTSITISNISVVKADQYTTIKDAVDAIIASGTDGGSVIVEEGVYPVNGEGSQTTITVPSNCSIVGQGNAVISLQNIIPAFQVSSGSQRVTVSGFEIDIIVGSSYECNVINMINVSNCIFESLKICHYSSASAYSYTPIWIEGNGNIVSNCTIYSHDSVTYPHPFNNGIVVNNGSEENSVVNNHISHCRYYGIRLSESDKNIISENTINNSYTGIYLYDSNNVVVNNNIISLNDFCGINLDSCGYCSVCNNSMNDNLGAGIYIEGKRKEIVGIMLSEGNVINGNICIRNGSTTMPGICLSECVIYTCCTANTCISNGNYGIMEINNCFTVLNLFVGNLCAKNAGGQLNVRKSSSVTVDNLLSEII
jgi:parallel beta-helix repeat protein